MPVPVEMQNSDGSPKKKYQQQLEQAFMAQQQALQQAQGQHPAYANMQPNEGGKVYMLSKNIDGSGNHTMAASKQSHAMANS